MIKFPSLLLLLLISIDVVHAFGVGRPLVRASKSLFAASATVAAADAETARVDIAVSPNPPSWEDLTAALEQSQQQEEPEIPPLVTLYRDTNGWCPFCERVWVALRVKQIPYQEQLISLQNKPEWYKVLVPTTLVPAVLFHHDQRQPQDDNDEPAKPQRQIIWESMEVLKALDAQFPNHGPTLVPLDDPAFDAAVEQADQLSTAGFGYIYSSRNATLTAEEKEAKKVAFVDALDALDQAIGESGGPFRLGTEFSGVDAIMVPLLERWRYQLPITMGDDMNILPGRSHLQAWFDAMDSYAPYSDRVAGDEYSWTATNAMFLRYFGGGEDKPEIAQAIERSEQISNQLTASFATAPADDGFAAEAATKLISNHDAVIKDCTNAEPLSQKDVTRATDATTADLVLRHVASILLSDSPTDSATDAPLVALDQRNNKEGALVARTVAARLCVPRDMGAPAAKLFRKVLSIVANRLEEKA